MTLLVGTRKGLFTLERGRQGWQIESTDFLGEPVTAAVVGHRPVVFGGQPFGCDDRGLHDG